MEKIVASAIRFYPRDSEYPVLVTGRRHCNCFEVIWNSKIDYDKKTCEQGFLTSNFTFIDRYEAAELAWSNGQMLPSSSTYQKIKRDTLKNDTCNHEYPLFSEDLW